MLSNAYFLAKFRFDTAENEPAKNLQNLLIFPILLTLTRSLHRDDPSAGHRRLAKISSRNFFERRDDLRRLQRLLQLREVLRLQLDGDALRAREVDEGVLGAELVHAPLDLGCKKDAG